MVTSMLGLFAENGPYVIDNNLNVSEREFSWSDSYNMLYMDQPVGAGFSFTDSQQGFANNEEDVAVDLYETLGQFFAVFPDMLQSDLYIAGEIYAGNVFFCFTHNVAFFVADLVKLSKEYLA